MKLWFFTITTLQIHIHILQLWLSSVKNSSRTIQSQDFRTVIPLTTRRFLFLIIFEFCNIEQYCKSSSKISFTGWKHGNFVPVAFGHSFSSNSSPLQPYCSEQTRRRDDLHDPRHSVHCDQVAEMNIVRFNSGSFRIFLS